MATKNARDLTVVQHLLMAGVKLTGIHARLLQFGVAAGEDPLAIERVEIAMQHIAKARFTLSAEEEPTEMDQQALPFE